MKATETPLLRLLDWSKQFIIPTYQRTYSRTQKQCQQLWDDIIRVWWDDTFNSHFIGGIVHVSEEDINFWSVFKTSVIDGQQRLTTCSLIIHALATTENSDGIRPYEKLLHKAITNHGEEWDDRYKLLPTKIDKDNYISIIEWWTATKDDDSNSNIINNYNFFKSRVSEYIDRLDIVFNGISKLFIVDIALNRTQDNPQLIFESMNSTGLALSKWELIKNYLLMGMKAQEQKELYEKYWYQMDKLLENNAERYDKFFRDYLTYKSPSWVIPKERQLYDDFKMYLTKSWMSTNDILQDIDKIFRQYAFIALLKKHPDSQIWQVLQDIDTLKVIVAYPIMIELFVDYEKGLLIKDHLIDLLRTIESYVFRRSICGIPTNSLNKTLAIMKRFLVKDTSQTYYDSFIVYIQSLKSYKEYPSNELFIEEIVKKDVYNFRNCKYLLEKLENYNKKEKISADNYTIEHILPQNKNLSQDWKNQLWENWKEVQNKYLHTLGNLTLTGYNSEYSDRYFTEKKSIEGKWFDASPIGLNGMLKNINKRDESSIQERASILAQQACKVWWRKVLPDEVINTYLFSEEEEVIQQRNYSDHKKLTWYSLELFEAIKEKILLLHPDVREEVKALYIAFKYNTNFVDIEVQKNKLRLTLNIDLEDLRDPHGICRDVSDVRVWWNGNVSVHYDNLDDLDYMIWLIKQALDRQFE
jgi:uncharacterized protein with ParB-like and HNH nuclease domain/predicted transport protein